MLSRNQKNVLDDVLCLMDGRDLLDVVTILSVAIGTVFGTACPDASEAERDDLLQRVRLVTSLAVIGQSNERGYA